MGARFWFLFWGMISLLAATAGIKAYLRRRASLESMTKLDDAAVRTIVATGALTVDEDEPLDLPEIDAEAERFWSETWDEPTEEH